MLLTKKYYVTINPEEVVAILDKDMWIFGISSRNNIKTAAKNMNYMKKCKENLA